MTTKMEVEESRASTSGEGATKTFDSILQDLESAEDNLQRIVAIAAETCGQLTDAPICDYDKLRNLAQEYNARLQSTLRLMTQHLDILEVEPQLRSEVDFSEEIEAMCKATDRINQTEHMLYPDVKFEENNSEINRE